MPPGYSWTAKHENRIAAGIAAGDVARQPRRFAGSASASQVREVVVEAVLNQVAETEKRPRQALDDLAGYRRALADPPHPRVSGKPAARAEHTGDGADKRSQDETKDRHPASSGRV